jgi:AcrR family transcriptional regulator
MVGSVATPWGPSDTLRARKLRPGPGTPREDVERNQRERLYGAMVAVVDEVGYDGMRTSLVTERAGVSRSTLYEYFDDRRECFFATFDAIMAHGVERVFQKYDRSGSWDERLRSLLEAVVEQIVEQPAAARLCLLELYCAGPDAAERRDRAAAALERIATQSIRQSPERADMPEAVVSALVGGCRTVFQRHLRRGAEQELPGLVDELWQWALSYHSPPVPLRTPRLKPPQDPGWVPARQVERLCAALVKTVCEKGYHQTKVADIAAAASMSLTTFYSYFPSKQEAFLATCHAGAVHAFRTAFDAYDRHPGDWPQKLYEGLRTYLEFMAAEPEWTYLSTVEQFGAGARGQERRDQSMDLYTTRLAPGFEEAPELGPIARDAIGGAVYTLMYSQIRNRGAAHLLEILPAATFVSLTPFIGAERATAIANGDGDPGVRS